MKSLSRVCALAAILSLGFAACSVTRGVPITLTLVFEPLAPRTFTTATGWEVELTEARALVGPVYAYAPPDALAWRRALAPSVALAHGGHGALDGRVVRAELLEARVVDALAVSDDVALDGLAGALDVLTLVLDAPPADGPTHGRHVWVTGTARRGGEEVRFAGGIAPSEPRQHRVEGVGVDGPPLDEGERLVVGVDPQAWLSEARFEELAPGADGVARIEGTQVERALWLGARSAASWRGRVDDNL